MRDAAAALEQARHDWKLEVTAAAERLASREMELGGSLAQAIAARTTVEHRLAEAEAAHHVAQQRAEADLTAAAERLARREQELGDAVAEAAAARTAIEARLAETEAALQQAHHRAVADLATAADRHATLEDRFNREVSDRTTLEERLAAADNARHDAARQHATELAALTTRLAEAQAKYQASIEQTASVEQQLTDAVAALGQARLNWKLEVSTAAERLAVREAELGGALAKAIAARAAVEQTLAEAEAAHAYTRERAIDDLTAAAERHAALEEQISHERASTRSLQDALTQVNEKNRLAAEASSGEIARLQQQIDGLRRQLDAMRTHAAALRRDAERVSVLQLQLEESQKENRRQFERAPYGLCECTRTGVITRANHSLARLLGYRSSADLQRMDFAATVFECSADLNWVLEQAVQTEKPQSVETTFKTRDRRRLFVRLHVLTGDGSVVIAIEDLTKLSAVEQRLREAQRLEAVGRVASEVAVACDTLLRDVTQGGQRWLEAFERDTRFRNQGELLLDDVTRAAGFLRQFVAYGNKQISSLEPVSVRRVLRDMEPVLKQVLGDDIVLVLPKTIEPFEVDVETERVERILVNVANYARERMPHGGRVKIQLASTVVEQRFLASHPAIRPGAHVLITITEILGATRPALAIQLPRARTSGPVVSISVADKPGMDLGPLMALIGDSGGHLWVSAEPAGNMTLQIHLPKRHQDEEMEPASWSDRGRQFARRFRQ